MKEFEKPTFSATEARPQHCERSWRREHGFDLLGFKRMSFLCLVEEAILVGMLAFVYMKYCLELVRPVEMLISLAFFALAVMGSNIAIYGIDRAIDAKGKPMRYKAWEFAVASIASTGVFWMALAAMSVFSARYMALTPYQLGIAAPYGCLLTAFGLGIAFHPDFNPLDDIRGLIEEFRKRRKNRGIRLLERIVAPNYGCDTCQFVDEWGGEPCNGCELEAEWPSRYVPKCGTLQARLWYGMRTPTADDEYERLCAIWKD